MLIYVNITNRRTYRQTHQKYSSEPHKMCLLSVRSHSVTFSAATKGAVALLQQTQLKVVRVKELVAEVALDYGLVGEYDLVEAPAQGRGPLAHEDVRGID
jgi:hypothetical protein